MADGNEEIAKKYCSSCKQDVPSANFEMHTIHCKRFLTPCPQCGESVNKNQLQEHIDENHAQVKCDLCGESVEKGELEDHKTSDCQKRNVSCNYCEITLPACDMSEHKESCGSRTEECDNCKRRILVKDMENHLASGCQTAVKTNGKTERETNINRMPERLIGVQNERPGGFGFPVHPQFSYVNEEAFNPYASEFKTSDFLNNETPRVTRTVRRTIQHNGASLTTLPQRNMLLNPDRQSNFNAKPKVENKNANVYAEEPMEQKKANDPPQRGRYGISDSDSDDEMKEKTPFPDLADDTLLPCEFCYEKFPADSLGFHQANCDNVPPTPRPFSPPKMKRLSLDPFPSRAPPFQPYQDEAAAIPTDDIPLWGNSPVIGDGDAPCEFCFSSFPLANLALHQVTCQENPNLHGSATPEQRRHFSEETSFEKTSIPKPDHPKSQAPQVLPNNSESTRLTLRPARPQTESTQAKGSSPNAQAREKRKLAPNFSVKETKVPQPPSSTEARAPTLPTNKSIVNDSNTSTGKVDRKPRRRRKSKPIPKKAPSIPKTFHEVNVLGGERQQNEKSFDAGFRGTYDARSFNSRTFEPPSPFTTSTSVHPEQHHPFVNRSVGPNQVTNPRWNSQGSRGRNSTRGQYSTRGHYPTRGHNPRGGYNSTRGPSYGSRTLTIPQGRASNVRQVSDIHNGERDVSSQVNLALQGQTPEFGGRRGRGQRLGSGHSDWRPDRNQLHPPKNNNWD